MKRFTMRIFSFTAVLLMLVLFVNTSLGAALGDYRTINSGTWNTLAIWQVCTAAGTPGTWGPALHTPDHFDGVITIRNTHTVIVTAAVNPDQVVVDAGGQITVNSGVTLTYFSTIGDIPITGTLQIDGTFTGVHLVTINSGGAVNVSGLLNVSGGNGIMTVNSGANLTLTGSGSVAISSVSTLTVSGTITMSGSSHITLSRGNGGSVGNLNSGGLIAMSGTAIFTTNGAAGRYFSFNNGSTLRMGPTALLNGTGEFDINSGATFEIGSTAGISSAGATGNVQSSARVYNAGANYTYNGTAAQVTGTGLPTLLTGTLKIDNPGNTVTLNPAKTIANGGTVNIVNGIFAAGTNLTMTTTSSITRSGGSMTGTPQGAGAYNVTYTGSSMTTTTELAGSGLKNVTINNTGGLTLGASTTVTGNLIINSGSQLIIPVLKNLTVNGTITNNNGTSGILIKSDATGSGSLIHYTASVPGTVERYTTGSKWHMISSPISDATSNMYLGKNLQQYDGCNWVDITATNIALTPMKGYAVYNSADFTAQYVGLLNQGAFGTDNNLTIPSCPGVSPDCGYNMVGNPYPDAIDWAAASGWTKIFVDATIYIENGGIWAYYTAPAGPGVNGGSRYIAMGQGFAVKANSSPATLKMNDNVRVHNNVAFLKEEKVVDYLIRLEVSGGNNYKDETVIYFRPEATTDYDGQYDAVKIMADLSEIPQIYSLITGNSACSNMLAINALPQTQPVPIGLSTSVQGTYTIKATEINSLAGIRLEDKTNGTFTDLAVTPYTFTFEPGQNDSRFVLHFYPLKVNDPKAEIAEIYSFDATLNVNMKENGNLYVYNMIGQLITSAPVETGMNKLNISVITGNYIVKIVTSNNSMVKKVFIN